MFEVRYVRQHDGVQLRGGDVLEVRRTLETREFVKCFWVPGGVWRARLKALLFPAAMPNYRAECPSAAFNAFSHLYMSRAKTYIAIRSRSNGVV